MMEQSVKILASREVIGAEIQGVDLSQPVSPAAFATIEAALNERAVLCLRQQHVTAPQYIDFARGAGFSAGRAGIATKIRYALGFLRQGFQRRPLPDAMPARQHTRR
jgi:TfdA family taurine catabolism dioxygenase TauD